LAGRRAVEEEATEGADGVVRREVGGGVVVGEVSFCTGEPSGSCTVLVSLLLDSVGLTWFFQGGFGDRGGRGGARGGRGAPRGGRGAPRGGRGGGKPGIKGGAKVIIVSDALFVVVWEIRVARTGLD
jgi:hypothetical protein